MTKKKIENYHTFTLRNGIRGAIVPIPGLQSATIEVFVKIGSKYETSQEFGLSHFLEHMAFKGTIKRPTATAINNEIDAKGASYNAGTSHEMTSYYITTVKENLPWAIEIISDILLNSTYPVIELEKERGVIIEEIRMYQDNPMMGLSGEFVKFLYKGSKIGCWNISGEVENIVGVDRGKILKYRNKYFNPDEIVVVASGNVDNKLEKIFKDCFEWFSNPDACKLPEVKVNFNADANETINKAIEQSHFCLGVPSIPWTDDRRYALKLIDIILSGNTSSRLYTKIREEKAWAYYVFPVSDSFKESGFLGMQTGVKLDKLEEAKELVMEEMINFAETVSEEELIRSKEFLLGKTQLAMDRSDYVSGFVGEKILLENRFDSIQTELDRYRKVGLKEVKDLSQDLFVKTKFKCLSVTRQS